MDYGFNPTDEELVCHYLYKKIVNEEIEDIDLMELDLSLTEPWNLPDEAKRNSTEWYFFNLRNRNAAKIRRNTRTSISGYWKAAGGSQEVLDPTTGVIAGSRRTSFFYVNNAPVMKTKWTMDEFFFTMSVQHCSNIDLS
ncbi:NAC domain containing protein 74 [Forsythia ovata]|uniref:NAC domain containing protein 74 n=1 Tax=Forsythia ovata TaxID=205694 RepID=A0ABD1X4M1_9LAMI